jgi:DNA-binding CsgD family transcriptional regulator
VSSSRTSPSSRPAPFPTALPRRTPHGWPAATGRAATLWQQIGCPYAALALAEESDPGALTSASATLLRLGAGATRPAWPSAYGSSVSPRPSARAVRRPRTREGLTDRELEAARLLATGASNAGIAETLFISPRTTAHHVSAVLAELGVSSRREAGRTVAAWSTPVTDPEDGQPRPMRVGAVDPEHTQDTAPNTRRTAMPRYLDHRTSPRRPRDPHRPRRIRDLRQRRRRERRPRRHLAALLRRPGQAHHLLRVRRAGPDAIRASAETNGLAGRQHHGVSVLDRYFYH